MIWPTRNWCDACTRKQQRHVKESGQTKDGEAYKIHAQVCLACGDTGKVKIMRPEKLTEGILDHLRQNAPRMRHKGCSVSLMCRNRRQSVATAEEQWNATTSSWTTKTGPCDAENVEPACKP